MMMISSFAPFSLFWWMRMIMRMKERGNNLVDDPLSRERCFLLATASSRPRHDWILEYAPPFLIIIIFFPFIIPSTSIQYDTQL